MITENFNLEHDAEIDAALQTILASPYFSSILTDGPVGVAREDVADHLAGHQAHNISALMSGFITCLGST